jgi:cytochrome c oxidase subunit 2
LHNYWSILFPLLYRFIPHIILLQSVENPASFQADHINRLFNHFNFAAGGVLLLVIVLLVYILSKFRRRAGDSSEGAHVEGNRLLETLMIGFPTVVLAWFFYETVTVIRTVMPANRPNRSPDVIITGHQYWWEVSYPEGKVITANEVHLPVGRSLLMEMRSADVIHDWWVPQLGNKMDLVPGHPNYLWLTIHRPGEYTGACSEFCGQQHAWMRIHVIAESAPDFSRWLDSNARNAAIPGDSLARRGELIFQASTCAGCHRIRGTPAIGTAGPDLTHIGSRSTLLTGLLGNTEDNLTEWIDHPQRIKEGAYMPDFLFPKDSVRAMARYLEQLK